MTLLFFREYPLKVLCPNSVCGRIIGKQGNVIKNFMEQTGAHIIVTRYSISK
jgi:hypothetical protein